MSAEALKKSMLLRSRLVYGAMLLAGLMVLGQALRIQTVQAAYWKGIHLEQSTRMVEIEANRGNIFSLDGSLLATSLPYFEVSMDVQASPISDTLFQRQVGALAEALAQFPGGRTAKAWKRDLMSKRREKGKLAHYFPIADQVSLDELRRIEGYPILKRGRYKGGLLVLAHSERKLLFGDLAQRTLGYDQRKVDPKTHKIGWKRVGIEGAYHEQLAGVTGHRLMQRIARNIWMPLESENAIEPKDGLDLVSTLDVHLQDVAHQALLRKLKSTKADKGCLVLMEVATGAVRAMVNLGRVPAQTPDSLAYSEVYNYAIGSATDPGSTFKLPALMVALEDGAVTLDEMVETGNGKAVVGGAEIVDSHEGGYGRINVVDVFAQSSNVGMARIVYKHYVKQPKRFIDGLWKMGLNQKLGIDLVGEVPPHIGAVGADDWSDLSLAKRSNGYEVRMTPLQTLSFYNAVANKGALLKPQFVQELRSKGEVVQLLKPEVLVPRICSDKTLEAARTMLEAVVTKGTASNLRDTDYKIAAKTGTAQMYNEEKPGYVFFDGYTKHYQASLCGYFPAQNPQYSMIVVVYHPRSTSDYYGNSIAGPVFREVADKVYSASVAIHKPLAEDTLAALQRVPCFMLAAAEDVEVLGKGMRLPYQIAGGSDWVQVVPRSNGVATLPLKNSIAGVPNVVGMGLRDALYLLENAGYGVRASGYGKVVKQTVQSKGNASVIILQLG